GVRWRGEAEAVGPVVQSGRFLDEFRARCVAEPPRDLVAMMTVVKRGAQVQRATLIDRYEEASRLTAMSRTTALTASAVAQWIAGGGGGAPGVLPLEKGGHDARAYAAITGPLEKHGAGVQWDWGVALGGQPRAPPRPVPDPAATPLPAPGQQRADDRGDQHVGGRERAELGRCSGAEPQAREHDAELAARDQGAARPPAR